MDEFEKMYMDYKKDIYKFLLRLTAGQAGLAEELTQDTFFRAITAFDRFQGKCQIKTWLCQIAKNTYYNYLRKEKKEVEVFDFLKKDADKFRHDAMIENLETREVLAALSAILKKLDTRSRDVYIYRIFSELPYSQIAAITGMSENSAKVLFCRTRIKVQNRLKEVYGYEDGL